MPDCTVDLWDNRLLLVQCLSQRIGVLKASHVYTMPPRHGSSVHIPGGTVLHFKTDRRQVLAHITTRVWLKLDLQTRSLSNKLSHSLRMDISTTEISTQTAFTGWNDVWNVATAHFIIRGIPVWTCRKHPPNPTPTSLCSLNYLDLFVVMVSIHRINGDLFCWHLNKYQWMHVLTLVTIPMFYSC